MKAITQIGLFLALLAMLAFPAVVHAQYTYKTNSEPVKVSDKGIHPSSSPDPIDELVTELNARKDLWFNGISPRFTLPLEAKPEEVLAQAIKMAGFGCSCQTIKMYEILEIRQVQLKAFPMVTNYFAVLVQSDLGKKICLLSSEGLKSWWTRFFDVPNYKPNQESPAIWNPLVETNAMQFDVQALKRVAVAFSKLKDENKLVALKQYDNEYPVHVFPISPALTNVVFVSCNRLYQPCLTSNMVQSVQGHTNAYLIAIENKSEGYEFVAFLADTNLLIEGEYRFKNGEWVKIEK